MSAIKEHVLAAVLGSSVAVTVVLILPAWGVVAVGLGCCFYVAAVA